MGLIQIPTRRDVDAATDRITTWPNNYHLKPADMPELKMATRGFWSAITQRAGNFKSPYRSRLHYSVGMGDIVFPEERRDTFIGMGADVIAKRVRLGRQLVEYALAKHDYTSNPDEFTDPDAIRRYSIDYVPDNICGDGSLQLQIDDRLLGIDAKVMLEVERLVHEHEGMIAIRDLTPQTHSSVLLKM